MKATRIDKEPQLEEVSEIYVSTEWWGVFRVMSDGKPHSEPSALFLEISDALEAVEGWSVADLKFIHRRVKL